LPRTNRTLETYNKRITRAQVRHLHAPAYLAAGAWPEAFEMFMLPCHLSGVFMSCHCRGVLDDFILAFGYL